MVFVWFVFEWLLEQGGVDAMHKINLEKSKLLYGYIDSSDFIITQLQFQTVQS
jgi:phosphoserine aminotransferase